MVLVWRYAAIYALTGAAFALAALTTAAATGRLGDPARAAQLGGTLLDVLSFAAPLLAVAVGMHAARACEARRQAAGVAAVGAAVGAPLLVGALAIVLLSYLGGEALGPLMGALAAAAVGAPVAACVAALAHSKTGPALAAVDRTK